MNLDRGNARKKSMAHFFFGEFSKDASVVIGQMLVLFLVGRKCFVVTLYRIDKGEKEL